MVTLDESRIVWLHIEMARLNLPVTFALDGTTLVVSMPRDLNTAAEVKVLRLVEQFTDDFRRLVV